MLTNEQIVRKVRGALLPFRCRIWDGDGRLRLKVFNHHRAGVVEIPTPLRRMRDERQLGFILRQVRDQLQGQGYTFNPL